MANAPMARLMSSLNASSRADAIYFRSMEARIGVLPLVVQTAMDQFAVKTLEEQEWIWADRAHELAQALGVPLAGVFSARPVASSVASSSSPAAVMKDPIRTAEHVSRVLNEVDMPHAIGGALSLGVWSEPRGTFDVNVNIWPRDAAHLLTALQALAQDGLAIDPQQAQEPDAPFITLWTGLTRVELFPPHHAIEHRAKDDIARSRLRPDGPVLPVLSAESLALTKVLLFRGQDLVDVERMIEVNTDLQHTRLRTTILEVFGESSERLQFWDRMFAALRDSCGTS